ncbi:hypothetical protein BGZ95_009575 [Linnemannia exigua]|uniref:Uncharacterized protein n=1 Tax=Linnemannia exigua TaxID=604196 RepID=A0AAD4DCK2_9FUNG|nr:hypothetical protein BGZ95_009575 [Linnemannia exigua]
MESQHVLNPWQQQRQQKQDFYDNHDQQQNKMTSLADEETTSLEDFFQGHKQVFYKSQLLLQQLQQRQRQQKSQEQSEQQGEAQAEGDDDGEIDGQRTAWSQLGIDSLMNQSSSTLADNDTPLTTVIYMTDSDIGEGDEGDVLEHLVQQLQSEVKGTRATVSELETKLNLAEHSNKRIVEELKMLLADAEENLAAAEHSDGTHPLLQSSRGSGVSDDDLNNVYNRICIALQALIDDAQSALLKNPTTKHTCTKPGEEGPPCYCQAPSQPNSRNSTPSPLPRVPPGYDIDLQNSPSLACRGSPRNSTTLLKPTKTESLDIHHLAVYGPAPSYAGTDEVSRMLWKQKHEEQHDRYRKSCHRLTLELDGRFLSTDSDDSEASSFDLLRRSRHRYSTSTNSSRPSIPSTPTTPSIPSTPTTPTTPTRPLQGILRSSKNTERLKKKCQVQFLNADIEGSRSRDRESSPRPLHRPTRSSFTQNQHQRQQQQQQEQQQQQQQLKLLTRQEPEAEQQVLRQYTHRSVSVGSNRSRGVVLQLYDLWQQTWLRTRIMHVITGSFEIIIIIWVVIKASQATLTWFGVKPKNINEWMMFIYGQRDTAGASAKELYDKVRKDGLRMRQVKAFTQKEPEALVEDLVAGVTSSTNGLLSPSTIIYGPAKKIVAHAVTGVALAFFSDGARRLLRKL